MPLVVQWGEFIEAFPEYQDVSRARIERFLDAAERELHPDVWGAKRGDGVLWLAAHMLALSPMGEPAKLATNGATSYGTHFDALVMSVASGFRVTS